MKPVILCLLAICVSPCHGQLTYKLAGGYETWPAAKRTAIINAMNQAVAIFNANGYFAMTITANYNAGVPTAQASYGGWLDFGGSISTRVALHEFAHTQGTGTYSNWAPHNSSGTWSGTRAAARVKVFDGSSAVLNCDNWHFWPYGLNYDSEDSTTNRVRSIKLVSALRWDMGLVKDSDGDGLPDDWEMHHCGNLNQSATDDTDRDGTNNLAEYNADTDPAQITALTWNGGTGSWDETTATWTGASTVWRNALCDQATFSGSAATVTAATGLQVNQLSFNTSGYQITGNPLTLIGQTPAGVTASGVSATINSALAGSGGFTKSGAGTLTLAGASANTFSGVASVLSGTLALGKTAGVNAIAGNVLIGDMSGSDVLLITANEQIANAAVISFNAGGSGNSAFLRINGGATETIGGLACLSMEQAPVIESGSAGTATLAVNNAADFTYDGILRDANGGTLALTKQGTGDLTLRNTGGIAAIAYTGTTTISGGSLTLNSQLSATTANELVIDSFASPVTDNATLVFDNGSGLTESFSPAISGSGELHKVGAGTVTIGRANSYTGGTTLGVSNAQGTVGGVLQITHGSALGTGTVSVYAGDPDSTCQGAQLQLAGGITVANPTLNLSGNGYGADNGVLLNLSGDNTVNSAIKLQVGAGGTIIASDSGTLTLGTGGIAAGTSGRTLEFTGAGTIQANGVIANGSTSGLPLTKSGSGTLILTASNTYTGGTTISAGTLNLSGNQSAANGGLACNVLNSSATVLNIGTSMQTSTTTVAVSSANAVQTGAIYGTDTATGTASQAVNVNGASGFTTTVTNAGPLAVGRNSTITLGSFTTWNQSGGINIQAYGGYGATLTVGSGSGSSAALRYTGSSAIQISQTTGTSSNSTLNLNGGTFTTGQPFNFNGNSGSTSAGRLVFTNGGTLMLSASITQLVTGDASGLVLLSTNGGTIDTNGYHATLADTISGSGPLTKKGTGSLTLSGTNTYTGATTIAAGVLTITGSIAASATTVNSGGTLAGTGTTGAVTIASGGTLTPGIGTPGTLATGPLTLAGGSTCNFQLGSTSDRVNVTGNLSLGGTIILSDTGSAVSGSYTLFTYTGTLTGSATVTPPAGFVATLSTSAGSVKATLTASSYATWARGCYTTTELNLPAISGPAAIPAGDGLTNLMKYALGLPPKTPAVTGITLGQPGTAWLLTYRRPANRTDITYAVEVSASLTAPSWSSAGVTHTRVATDDPETWQASYPPDTAPQTFFRLRVTRP